jgi:hypothetical protein
MVAETQQLAIGVAGGRCAYTVGAGLAEGADIAACTAVFVGCFEILAAVVAEGDVGTGADWR